MQGDRVDCPGGAGTDEPTRGSFLVLDDPELGVPIATLFLEPHGPQGYFGLLAVHPDAHGRGSPDAHCRVRRIIFASVGSPR